MRTSNCYICNNSIKFKFEKYSEPLKKFFKLYECINCNLLQISPLPSAEVLHNLYQGEYFNKRSSRGYNDYTSAEVKQSITNTFIKNLNQLDFFKYENTLNDTKSILEIGCAGGHFLEYLHKRDWKVLGIDISDNMIQFAKSKGLPAICTDFLKFTFEEQYDLIVLWATLEHLTDPRLFLQKMESLLKDNGKIYISTINYGFWGKIYGINWRYLNVPEHIYYFNYKNLKSLCSQTNLKITRSFTYGSGFTQIKNMNLIYRLKKLVFDKVAKLFHSGDLIVLELTKDKLWKSI